MRRYNKRIISTGRDASIEDRSLVNSRLDRPLIGLTVPVPSIRFCRHEGTRWSEEEDAALGNAWATAAAQGANQGSAIFWESVYATFKELVPDSERNRKGLRNRWCNTHKDVIKFHILYSSTEETDEDQALHTALWLYQQKYKQKFELLHCWREVRASPKFLENVLKANAQTSTTMQLLQTAVESRTAVEDREEGATDDLPSAKRRKHVSVMPRPALEPSATPLTGINATPPPWFEQAMQDYDAIANRP